MAGGELLTVERAALDGLVAAALNLQRVARVASPELQNALARLTTSARPVSPARAWLAGGEAALALGVCERTVRRQVAAGVLESRRAGRRLLIRRAAVDS